MHLLWGHDEVVRPQRRAGTAITLSAVPTAVRLLCYGARQIMGFENGKLVRVVLRAVENLTGDQQVNTLHYDLQDSVVPGNAANDPQSLADFFRDNVLAAYKGIYSAAWTVQPVLVAQELDPQAPFAPRSEWVSGAAAAGTRGTPTDLLPKAACSVASLTTSHIGKRYRGRMFLGGALGEVDQSGGVWQSSIITLWNALLAAIPRQPDIATGTSASTADWVVYSRTNRAADLDPYASPVVSTTVRSQFRWLRSREA